MYQVLRSIAKKSFRATHFLFFTLTIGNQVILAESGITTTAAPEQGSSGQRAVAEAFSQLFISNQCSVSTSPTSADVINSPESGGVCGFLNTIGAEETSSSSSFSFNGAPAQQLSAQADIQVNTTALASPAQQTKKLTDRLAQRRLETQLQQDCLNRKNKDPLNGDEQISDKVCQPRFNEPLYAPNDKSVLYGPLGLFISGKGSWGETDSNDGETGFSQQAYDGTIGMDYQLFEQLVAGLSFNYSRQDTNLEIGSGHLDSDNYRLSAFASWIPVKNAYIDLILGHGWVDFDLSRECTACNGSPLNAQSDFDGNQYFASIGTGYTFRQGAWSLKGYARGDYIYLKTSGYTLNFGLDDGSVLANQVQGQNVRSLISTLGGEVGRAFSTRFGVIIPKFRAEWVHEFKNEARSVSSQFLVGSTSSDLVTVQTARPERNWFNLGTTVQFIFPNSLTGFLGYEALVMQDSSNHAVTGGVRFQF